jgi:hypothetical protein
MISKRDVVVWALVVVGFLILTGLFATGMRP